MSWKKKMLHSAIEEGDGMTEVINEAMASKLTARVERTIEECLDAAPNGELRARLRDRIRKSANLILDEVPE